MTLLDPNRQTSNITDTTTHLVKHRRTLIRRPQLHGVVAQSHLAAFRALFVALQFSASPVSLPALVPETRTPKQDPSHSHCTEPSESLMSKAEHS